VEGYDAARICDYWTGMTMCEKDWKTKGPCPMIVLCAWERNK
jgi:hypothetical protein